MERLGLRPLPRGAVPTVVIINTCAVTAEAERKSRQQISRLRRNFPETILVVMGCQPQVSALADKKPANKAGADIVIGTRYRNCLPDLIKHFLAEWERNGQLPSSLILTEDVNRVETNAPYEEIVGEFYDPPISDTRALLKIQDGCDNFCSYCLIPLLRGRMKSRSPAEILAEAWHLLAVGKREIVLTGIHICSYGKDRQWSSEESCGSWLDICEQVALLSPKPADRQELAYLPKLADRQVQTGSTERSAEALRIAPAVQRSPSRAADEDEWRLRLGSLEPGSIDREAAERLAALDRLCPHFHLSLQSGSDRVLSRMRRKYTAAEYVAAVEELRAAFRPREVAITTDVIVGFPGESESDFAATLELCRALEPARIHVFPYSARPHTAAAGFADRVAPEVIRQRTEIMLDMAAECAARTRERRLGQELRVLIETVSATAGEPQGRGYSDTYDEVLITGLPPEYGDHQLREEIKRRGKWLRVRPNSHTETYLVAIFDTFSNAMC